MRKNQFYAMLARMKYINRWGLMRNTREENDSEHSLDVAFIAHALGLISNVYFEGDVDVERIAVLAMFHDVTEIITGDMPTPVKYYSPVIRSAYKDVEKVAKEQLLTGLPEEMRPFYDPLLMKTEEEAELWKFVKAADRISAYLKCVEESRTGNTDFADALQTNLKQIRDMGMPEVDYFMDHFAPAYTNTLDASNKERE